MNFTPYEGKKPYIFVSYAHSDQAVVTKIIETLHEKGYRIWYDTGIMPGDDPFEKIANHICDSALVIVFLSHTCIRSHYCKSEVNFALSKSKNLICIVLEEFEMSVGWQMQLQNTQLLFYHKLSEEAFYDKLLSSERIGKVRRREEGEREELVLSEKRLERAEAGGLPVSEDGTLTIPWEVTEIGEGAFRGRTDLRCVILGENVRKIVRFAFSDCVALKTIVLPESLEIVEPQAFSGCAPEGAAGSSAKFEWSEGGLLIKNKTMLIAAFLKRGETQCELPLSLRYIEPYAFDGIDGLKAIKIPDGTVYIASRAVSGCSDLETVELPASVKYIAEDAFSAERQLKMIVPRNSYAEQYCLSHGFALTLKDD